MYSLVRTLLIMVLLITPVISFSFVKGIYLTEPTVSMTSRVKYYIQEAKRLDIDTFVIDVQYRNKHYAKNLKLINDAGIKYVARVVIFPYGGSHYQITNENIWKKKMALVEYAIDNGAKEIQLDYIRYNVKSRSSPQNAQYINKVIEWFRQQINGRVPLQIDVFGEVSFGPSNTIGQDIKVFASNVNAVSPMVYPSHYEPASYHSYRPYETVFKSVMALRKQFNYNVPFRLVPFIEVSNYRRRMSFSEKVNYIREQIRAVKDGGADGWYAWSPTNKYRPLFEAIRK